jgi:hypothetical protein
MKKITGYDPAIIGTAFVWSNEGQIEVLVYDAEIIREMLVLDDMSFEEAREYIEFNIEGAYVGPDTPILVWTEDYYELDD